MSLEVYPGFALYAVHPNPYPCHSRIHTHSTPTPASTTLAPEDSLTHPVCSLSLIFFRVTSVFYDPLHAHFRSSLPTLRDIYTPAGAGAGADADVREEAEEVEDMERRWLYEAYEAGVRIEARQEARLGILEAINRSQGECLRLCLCLWVCFWRCVHLHLQSNLFP